MTYACSIAKIFVIYFILPGGSPFVTGSPGGEETSLTRGRAEERDIIFRKMRGSLVVGSHFFTTRGDTLCGVIDVDCILIPPLAQETRIFLGYFFLPY
jgi:hypothetical protein